jgi:putative addiction module component (TIGR02574 family)
MAVLSKAEISALSTEERLALIDDLWESLENPGLDASVEAAHRQIVEERLANYDPASDSLLTFDEVVEQLRVK